MTQVKIPQRPSRMSLDSYEGFASLPPLVGLHAMGEAATIGLTVAESVARLKRIHWSLKRLHTIFVSRITSTSIYELKMAFSLHAHYCAEHVGEFSTGVREMREPPMGWKYLRMRRWICFSTKYWLHRAPKRFCWYCTNARCRQSSARLRT